MKRYIPLNASESAVLPDADTLLPRDEVYEPLARMIEEAVKKAEAAKGQSLNQLREHNAISIDGARGTGKTAVLVNLKSYLKERDVLKDVHLFDPIDPTLLEEGESLFLHIIVAAVLHDKDVKEAQRKEPNKARNLNQTLEKLAQSLESIETQKNYHGMDKIRAMYSNKHLADCVQDFFREVLSLLGKKLLILPIDDVDTSLNRAFENLEIVRRYLATPYVLPIVSGDRELYNEVTWRDFHGRLTKDSKHLSEAAYETAVELAAEYQRKILPFPRRLTMPEVSQYWQEKDIYLGDGEKKEVMPLRNFIAWLEIFLSGPVNGLEDSQLPLPIPSVRALTQLLNRCQDLIPALPKRVKEASSALQVKRAWQMPDVPEEVMEAFEKAYQEQHKEVKRDYNPAYATFATELAKQPMDVPNDWIQLDRQQWTASLKNHFQFETEAGPVFLVLQAQEYWQQWRNTPAGEHRGSIFDTALFQPLWHSSPNYQRFEKRHDLSSWKDPLTTLPELLFPDLSSSKTILPYPVLEVGCSTNQDLQTKLTATHEDFDENFAPNAALLLNLLPEYYIYQLPQCSVVLNIGRIFELIIGSLVGEVELSDLQRILNSAPFFSAKSQAQEITISKQDYIRDLVDYKEYKKEKDILKSLNDLQLNIKNWRESYCIDKLDISPWLIYKVFKKVYLMVSDNGNYSDRLGSYGLNLEAAFNKIGLVFYATWSAFGSFEKGRLFGLPELITDVDLRKAKDFESNIHFNMNIGHLAPHRKHIELLESADELVGNKDELKIAKARHKFGIKTRTITDALAYHPLKDLIDKITAEL
ncbi:antiviral RADAR system adenosine triphosphatase RdrA [Aquaspirillum serpens]|uniref:antiviral RADAR system adenosine triphosphatase RdrA n=1 Tax=Aquaspirillum serpens TaxID=190 RepID=UPI0003B616E5|nr:antiviral RADAR system adenosine triphosphatase RdrA [Aquaspirillum serpens]